jgi:PEP-CTERM motif
MIFVLIGGILSRSVTADPVTYQQIPQEHNKQLARQVVTSSDSSGQTAQVQSSQAAAQEEPPTFVRLPDGRIVPYGPGVICTENCVEPFEAKLPNRPRLLIWVLPVIAGGLIAGLIGGGVIGGGSPGVAVTPTPFPTIAVTPTPTPLPSPTPDAKVPEPSTLVLLGIGMTMLARKRLSGKKKADDLPLPGE